MTNPPLPAGTYDVTFTGAVTFTGKMTVTAPIPTSVPVVPPKPATPTPAPTPLPAPAPTPTPGTTGRLGDRVKFGAFVYSGTEAGGGSGDPWNPDPHLALEKTLGRTLSPVSVFLGWDTDLPAQQLGKYGTRDILIAWDPNTMTAGQILAGDANAFLDRFGTAVNSYSGGGIYVRLMAEMNGDWAKWSAANGAMGITSPAQYVQVWKYIVGRVRAKTTRVKWVWCPNITDNPPRSGNRLEEYWPGPSYVDVLGFDGYNWGNAAGQTWTSFEDLVGKPQGGAAKSIYDRLAALDPAMPIWLCEFGCKEDPGKAKWYADMLASTRFPRLAALVAFDIQKENDWRILSTSGTAETVAAGLKRP